MKYRYLGNYMYLARTPKSHVRRVKKENYANFFGSILVSLSGGRVKLYTGKKGGYTPNIRFPYPYMYLTS